MHRRCPVLQRLTCLYIAGTLGLFLITSACGGGTSVSELSGPTGVRCQSGFAVPPAGFPADGGRVTVVVSAARECSWSASADASWLQLSPSAGQGESEVTIVVAANQQARPRTGTIVLNDSRTTVTQDAAPCRFSLNHTEGRIDSRGGRLRVTVTTQQECAWAASSGEP